MARKRKEDTLHEYRPDYAVPPGATILETIEALGMTQTQLAVRTGRTLKTINEIVQGTAPITPETAIQLERVLGVPASFWNNLERNFRTRIAELAERMRLEDSVLWLRQFPVAALIRRGVLRETGDKVEQVRELLSFFGVASPNAWDSLWSEIQVAYRRSRTFQSSPGALSVWLRLGELAGQRLRCAPYDRARFRSALASARGLTQENAEVIEADVKRLCAEAGVAVVFVPELPGTCVSGATRWLSPEKALIQLSLRHKGDDHLWFGFFHEAAHILSHGKKEIFVEEEGANDDREKEADDFASDWLLPPAEYRGFVSFGDVSEQGVRQFAASMRIAPGIVVGRLQHDGHIPLSHFNRLKRRYRWVDEDGTTASSTRSESSGG